MNSNRTHGRGQRAGHGGGGMRHAGGGIPSNRNYVFDSKGPELRLRGTAQQLFEKYLQLGRDATGGGDRVMAESCFQYAEHYFRVVRAISEAQQSGPPMAAGAGDRELRDVPIGASPADGLAL